MNLDDAKATLNRLIDSFEALKLEVTNPDPCSLRRVPDAKERGEITSFSNEIIDRSRECVDDVDAIQDLFDEIQTRRRVS